MSGRGAEGAGSVPGSGIEHTALPEVNWTKVTPPSPHSPAASGEFCQTGGGILPQVYFTIPWIDDTMEFYRKIQSLVSNVFKSFI
jgi:hypothetical protein